MYRSGGEGGISSRSMKKEDGNSQRKYGFLTVLGVGALR